MEPDPYKSCSSLSRGGTTECESFCVHVIEMQLNRANPGHKSTSVFIDKARTDMLLSCT